MTISYFSRLIGLSMASFFLIHTLLAILIRVTSRPAIRFAHKIEPVWAARFLLSYRLLPAVIASVLVAGLCVPSYLRLEPDVEVETAGVACVVAALFGIAIVTRGVVHAVRVWFRSFRYIASRQKLGSRIQLAGAACPAWIIDGRPSLFAMTGVFRPSLFLSRELYESLSPDEFSMALRHEDAHRSSRDNLKRFLILLSPGMLPFWSGFTLLEQGWCRFAEWAADDRAVDGDEDRSVSLASALVRVARLGSPGHSAMLATSLMGEDPDLPARVTRLLNPSPVRRGMGWMPVMIGSAALTLAISLIAFLPLSSVHSLLEQLMD